MKLQMGLLVKCVAAVIIMIFIHCISNTPNFYISGLALSFPGLSILAYYFMYIEHGIEKVRLATSFAMLSVILFAIFLFILNHALRKNNFFSSILVSSITWISLASLLVIVWNGAKRI